MSSRRSTRVRSALRSSAVEERALRHAAVGAGIGVAFTHAVRDSDLTFGQYSRGAIVFGALGAGIGLGVDALLHRRVVISPTLSRRVAGVSVLWRW